MGFELVVYRNNVDAKVMFEKMQACENNVVLMLSPGPGSPSQAGCMPELIQLCKGQFPIIASDPKIEEYFQSSREKRNFL